MLKLFYSKNFLAASRRTFGSESYRFLALFIFSWDWEGSLLLSVEGSTSGARVGTKCRRSLNCNESVKTEPEGFCYFCFINREIKLVGLCRTVGCLREGNMSKVFIDDIKETNRHYNAWLYLCLLSYLILTVIFMIRIWITNQNMDLCY